jgi:hypothetical protein
MQKMAGCMKKQKLPNPLPKTGGGAIQGSTTSHSGDSL